MNHVEPALAAQRLQNYPVRARSEAWVIGQWYLELVLLKWFGYSGEYVNRQPAQHIGQTEAVP